MNSEEETHAYPIGTRVQVFILGLGGGLFLASATMLFLQNAKIEFGLLSIGAILIIVASLLRVIQLMRIRRDRR